MPEWAPVPKKWIVKRAIEDARANGDVLIPFRLRAVKIAVAATYLIVASMLVFPFLPGGGPTHPRPYVGLLVVAGVGVTFIAMLPWKRLFESGYGLWVMYAWSAFDILLITGLVAVQGSRHADMFFIYALTTVFFGVACYPIKAQAALLTLTFASYLGILWYMPWEMAADMIFLRMAIMGTAAFLSTTLSMELSRQINAHGAARAESGERARLLALVASAIRSMSTLDQSSVLKSVIEAVNRIGFETSNVVLFDEDRQTFRVVESTGLPDAYCETEHPWDVGMPGLVMEAKKTVVVEDYASLPQAVPVLRDDGYKSVVAAPVWTGDVLGGVLVGGTRSEVKVMPEQVEAFELLAAQVGRALENASAYESEHEAVQRLAELDRLKSDFLSNVSHELRTPLTSIHGMTVTVLERWNALDEESRIHLLERVGANASTLNDIITSLLDFSRLEAGKLQIREDRFDLSELVTGATARLGDLFGDHNLSVAIPGSLFVHADPLLIQRVVENLLTNATKHTRAGSRIWVTVHEAGGRAVVAVADDGPGIPPAELRHLGERFFRGGDENTRSTRGVGLGLALTKEILALHGAELSIDTEVGKGTSFRFSLPVTSRVPTERVLRPEHPVDA